jgi:hypothetical protein
VSKEWKRRLKKMKKQQLEEAYLEDEDLIVKAHDVISNEEDLEDLEEEDDEEVDGKAKRVKMQ